MRRHFQCVEQVKSPSNITKYCACHAKWMSSMICVTYETSFPMRGANQVTLQPHQILRLPRNLEAQDFSAKTPWMLPPIERRFDDNPNTSDDIRRYPTTKSSSRTRRFGDLTRPSLETILYCKIQHFASLLSPKMSRSAAPVTKSHPPTSPNTAPATQNECHHWSASQLRKSFPMRGASKVTLQHQQILRLPRKMHVDCTELRLYGTITITSLMCYFAELLVYRSITLRIYYFTDLLLYWCVTLRN